MSAEETPWLDEAQPHDPARSQAQVDGILRRLGPEPKEVLDLGCGCGRVLVPLARAGHRLIGMDRRRDVLAQCRARLSETGCAAELIEADFLDPWPRLPGRFDAVCCLGNTLMTVADVDQAVELLGRAAQALSDSGVFITDDCPAEFWPQLTGGNWQSGLSPDGTMQMVWEPDDAVFALRYGAQIDLDCDRPRPTDTRLRLWSAGALRLAGRVAGLSTPRHLPEAGLLVMGRADRGRPRVCGTDHEVPSAGGR